MRCIFLTTLSAVLLFSYKNSNQEISPKNIVGKDTIPQKEKSTTSPNFVAEIPLQAAATLIYNQKQTRLNTPSSGNEDTRFIDFPIKELTKYLNYAKDSINADGIRVYLGRYPDSLKVKYHNSLTVMFMPTLRGEDIVIDPVKKTLIQVLDEGQLCPPPYPTCIHPGAILMNTADGMSPDDVKKYSAELITHLRKK